MIRAADQQGHNGTGDAHQARQAALLLPQLLQKQHQGTLTPCSPLSTAVNTNQPWNREVQPCKKRTSRGT